MTIDEAKDICAKLTKVNIAIWNASGKDKELLRDEFKSAYRSVIEAGFKIRRWRKDGNPMFTPRIDRHKEDVCMMAADSGIKRDCTTRCISLCTGVPYDIIRAEQLRNATAAPSWATWRHDVVWEKSLESRGFIKINLAKRHVSRSTFLKHAKTLPLHEGVIATKSSGHLAAIDMASRKVLDTWNSSGGRITSIYVPKSQKDVYYKWLREIGCIYITFDVI